MSRSKSGNGESSHPETSDLEVRSLKFTGPEIGGFDAGAPEARPGPLFAHGPSGSKGGPLGWRSWLPSLPHLLTLAVILLILSNLGLWVGVQRARRGPQVAVVGVREMTQRYLAKISTAQMSPQELAMRTSLFVAVAQEEIRRQSPVSGQLVLARECVLSGEETDITPALERNVEARLAAAFGGPANAAEPMTSRAPASLAAPVSSMTTAP